MKDFKRLLAYAKPYSRFWPGYLILSILSVIFGVANYALIKPLLDILFNPEQLTQLTERTYHIEQRARFDAF